MYGHTKKVWPFHKWETYFVLNKNPPSFLAQSWHKWIHKIYPPEVKPGGLNFKETFFCNSYTIDLFSLWKQNIAFRIIFTHTTHPPSLQDTIFPLFLSHFLDPKIWSSKQCRPWTKWFFWWRKKMFWKKLFRKKCFFLCVCVCQKSDFIQKKF